MPQEKGSRKPLFLNLDSSYTELKPDESPFVKDVTWDINANGGDSSGTSNLSGEGQNLLALTPVRSNVAIPNVLLPEGFNKNIGSFLDPVTNDTYVFNKNDRGNDGIYLISGDSLIWTTVIIDPKLSFSFEQEGFIADNRVKLRIIKNSSGAIVAKFLIWTDGLVWHGWINVTAAIATNGFDVSQYPYWALQPPHFDREELLQLAVRPPMDAPIVTPIPNTDADKGTDNRVLDYAFQFGYDFDYTDGRPTTVSPYSLPFITKREDFLSNAELIPKKALIKLYAGSCMVEKINIYYRFTYIGDRNDKKSSLSPGWSVWYRYDTIYKYGNELTNTNEVLNTPYWLRTNPWASYNYDSVQNTISYVFDNSKAYQIIDPRIFTRIQSALPQLSIGGSDLGDAILWANNRSGYDNFSDKVTRKFTAGIDVSPDASCQTPIRNVRLYSMTVNAAEDFSYFSQPGWYNGEDTQERFGGVGYNPNGEQCNTAVDEAKYFALDFSDRTAYRCYLKGTPHFSDGQWYQVNSDNSLVKIDSLLDISNGGTRTYINNVFKNGGSFVCVYDFEIPAGRYIATIGRHNEPSSGDYRGKSTYIIGLANSRQKSLQDTGVYTIKPNAVVDYSKEMEIDCTVGNVDVWGNGKDLFYLYCPHIQTTGPYVFFEGYFKESSSNPVGMELFPYGTSGLPDNSGVNTDKNGFYFAYTKQANSAGQHVRLSARVNCTYPTFINIPTAIAGTGWKVNPDAYLTDFNGGQVGFANYVRYNILITNIGGTVGYQNIGVSIKDGATVYTDQNGMASLLIHNGQQSNRNSNVYINAGGDFLISILNCGYLPLFNYDETLVPCQNTTERVYPIRLIQEIIATAGEQKSVKSNSTGELTIVGADLAGRRTFCRSIGTEIIPSFCQRNSVSATVLTWALNGPLQLNQEISTKDIKWLGFYYAPNKYPYLQWVGDKIEYVDSNGNITSSPSNASFVKITIDSLLQANITNNFSLFATYQFVQGDKIRIYDDGNGQLFNTALYGQVIDVEIQGTNYNQAAINANVIPPPVNTVLPSTQTVGTNPATLYVKYDSRFDKLKGATGFWIELYTPTQKSDILPYNQIESFFPVINGEIALYTGGGVSNPQYNHLTGGILNYWDTYLLRRSINIVNAGNKFFNHPFESPNITDTWGANIDSGGSVNTVNPDAKQLWYEDQTIRSDNFVINGTMNGLGTYRSENIKTYRGYGRGGLIAVFCQYSIVMFVCENTYFLADFNMIYTSVKGDNIVTVNLNNQLGEPHQKVGDNYGVAKQDFSSFVSNGEIVGWYDRKNSGYIVTNYSNAVDITRIREDKIGMIQSHFTAKSDFITSWNNDHDISDRFDVNGGIDMNLNNIYVTFRPRRSNSDNELSFVNQRRFIDTKHQETFVYSLDTKRWLRTSGFTPESYANLRGNESGIQMVGFASGEPYYFRGNIEDGFSNFFGVDIQPCITLSINTGKEVVSTLLSLIQNINGPSFYADNIFGTDNNSFTFIPSNLVVDREKVAYAYVMRNMVSYPPMSPELIYLSMLMDGKRMWGDYFVCSLVMNWERIGEYFQIDTIEYKLFNDENAQQ